MATVDAVGSSSAQAATTNRLGEISSDEFLNILFTELQQQDPFKPNDSSALLEQLSSIRSIESDQSITDKLGTLVGQNEFASAAGLIGTIVSGLDEQNARTLGYVSSVSKTDEGPVLNLRTGERVPLAQVDEIITEQELLGDTTP